MWSSRPWQNLWVVYLKCLFFRIGLFLHSTALMACTYSDTVQNVTIINLLFIIYNIWATKDSRLVMLLLLFKPTFHFDIRAKSKSQFISFCPVYVFVLHVSEFIINLGRQRSWFYYKKKKKSLVKFLLGFGYIKNIWLEHSQNKREFLHTVFVVNRKASWYFSEYLSPSGLTYIYVQIPTIYSDL